MKIIKGNFDKQPEETSKKLLENLMSALALSGIDDDTEGRFLLIIGDEGVDAEDDYKILTEYNVLEVNYILDVTKASLLGIS